MVSTRPQNRHLFKMLLFKKGVGGNGAVENPPLQAPSPLLQKRLVEGPPQRRLAPQPGSPHCGGMLAQVPGVGHLGAGGVDGPSVHFVQAQFSVSTGAQQWPIQLRRQRGQLEVEERVRVVGLGFSSGPPE